MTAMRNAVREGAAGHNNKFTWFCLHAKAALIHSFR
jgi:hypothetical protein